MTTQTRRQVKTSFPLVEGTHPGTILCQCARATGHFCQAAVDPANVVIVERMPVWLRASHTAAGNSGTWPHNGAERLACTDDCASLLVDGDEEWTSRVRP